MEREFKFLFPPEISVDDVFDYVFSNAFVTGYVSGSVRTIEMYSKYYDYDDRRLRKNRISLRLRKENDVFVMTVKYGGGTSNGLHERNEENIICDSDILDISLLADTSIYNQIVLLCSGGGEIRERFGAEFTRNAVLLCEAESDTRMELALDIGYLFNFESKNNNTEQICELELELLSGDDKVFERIGNELKEKLKMQPFDKSKASRAAALK